MADPRTGEILAEAGEKITREKAVKIQNAGINEVYVTVEGKPVKVLGNNTVDINKYLSFDVSDLNIKELVNCSVLKDILQKAGSESEIKE